MQLIASLPSPTSYYLLGGYVGVASTYLELYETGDAEERKASRRADPQGVPGTKPLCATLPLGRPAAYRCHGRLLWLKGRQSAALKAWDKGLRVAARLKMSYEEALSHLEIGQRFPVGHPERDRHLTSARDIFASQYASFDLGRARRLLSP